MTVNVVGSAPVGYADSTEIARAEAAELAISAGLYHAVKHGLLCDGLVIYDATLSSGHNITSASYTFVAGDVGKTVALDGGASSGTLITTILSVAGGVATLNTSVLNALSGRMYFGTDDTAALQALITTLCTSNGGTIMFPDRSITMIAGTQQSGSVTAGSYSGTLLLPARAATAGVPQLSIRLAGSTPSNYIFWGPQASGNNICPPGGGAPVIYCTDSTSGGHILDIIPTVTGIGSFSTWDVEFANLTFLQQRQTLTGGPNLFYAWSTLIEGCTFGPDISSASLGANSPSGSAVGVTLPGVDNDARVEMRASNIYGYPVGLIHYEHAVLDDVSVSTCKVAIQPSSSGDIAGHLAEYRKVLLQINGVHIQPGGKIYVTGTVSMESRYTFTGSPWWLTTYDISDTNGYLAGILMYHKTDENVLGHPASNLVVTGCANIKLINAGTVPGVFTPTIPATTVASQVQTSGGTQVARDCQVIITGGTVTVIAVDGVTTGLTSGSIFVPSGHTFTLTYSGAPTVVAIAL